jgi:hypothetical protein
MVQSYTETASQHGITAIDCPTQGSAQIIHFASIVFARAKTIDGESSDLWLMGRDGSNLRLLVKNGRIPNWGSQPPTAPPSVTSQRLFLPAVQR